MAKFIIKGGNPVQGEVKVSGNKNAALPIIAAAGLTTEKCIIKNIPQIRDVKVMLELLKDLGKNVEQTNANEYQISGDINKNQLNKELAGKIRASILYMSVLLVHTGEAELPPPGGCVIGRRNIEPHFEVMKSFGAQISISENKYSAKVKQANSAYIFLKEASVTATENAMLIASKIEQETIIENAACEPHVDDLAFVLGKMGAKITGIGTNRLVIQGKSKLGGFEHRIVPDHIEAGTFAIASACTGGNLLIHDAIQSHLRMTEIILRKMNINLEYLNESSLKVNASNIISENLKIKVGLWPGFPTDLMSPMIVLATQAKGATLCHDWMYESRMFFVDKLIVMGANIIQCDPHRVLVNGPTALRGQKLSSPDIRAGIALVIAALSANGTSEIDNIEIVDRGYQEIEKTFNRLGTNIVRSEI